ncbi:MAG: glutathione S-transferase N-terminal domain-containing protein, partial [Nitrosomonadaceae bacterium]
MKLVGSLTSPYVRKVRIVLAENNIGYDFDVDIPWNV